MSKPSLKLEDLKIGMQVTVAELKNIYDINMLVTGITNINLDEVGTLIWFGEYMTDEADALIEKGAKRLYFDKVVMKGEVRFIG